MLDIPNIHICVYICVQIWFLPSSTHKAFGPKRTWGMRFIIVCAWDPNRYSSDMNILARLHMWRTGGEQFTGRAPKSLLGEASLPIKIPFTDGSFGSNFIDLTKKWFMHPCVPKFYDWSLFCPKNMIRASIVLFGIWTFFCESYAPVVLVWGQKSDLHICIIHTYIYDMA